MSKKEKFVNYNSEFISTEQYKEFTTFKNLSFMVLIIQFILVFIYMRNQFKAFKYNTDNEMLFCCHLFLSL